MARVGESSQEPQGEKLSELLKVVSPAAASALASDFAPPGTPKLLGSALIAVACLCGWLTLEKSKTGSGRLLKCTFFLFVSCGLFAAVRFETVKRLDESDPDNKEEVIVSLWKSVRYIEAEKAVYEMDANHNSLPHASLKKVLENSKLDNGSPWSDSSMFVTEGIFWATLLLTAGSATAFGRIASEYASKSPVGGKQETNTSINENMCQQNSDK